MSTNITVIQHSLNAGEVSARAEGRQDQNKYLASCRTLENWLPLTVGGVTRRWGFRKVQKAKLSGQANADVVLLPFTFSSDQAYVIEAGNFYFRFFKEVNGVISQIATDVVTPYAANDLRFVKLGSFQSADEMYIMVATHPTMKLARISINPDVFTLTEVSWDPPATQEDQPTNLELGMGTISLSATTGTGQTATSAGFQTGDVGRLIKSGPGTAVVTSWVSGSSVTIDIVDDFTSTTLTSWSFSGFGNASMDPSVANANQFVSVGASLATFRPQDLDKYMVIYGGLIHITQIVSQVLVNGIIVVPLRDVPNDPSTGLPYTDPPLTAVWSLEVNSWTVARGFPTCGCFFQSRLWACKDETINGSATGDFENFGKGSAADDAVQETIDDDQVNPIRWVKGLGTRGGILQLATAGGVYAATSSAEGKPLAPNDFSVLPVSSRGSALIPPLRIGAQLVYVQYGNRKMRELVFDFVTDKYKSPSLLVLAEHLTEDNTVTEQSYQQEFNSIIWAVRDDGQLLGLVYQEDENVMGWSRHPTDGLVKSITVIPRPSTGKDWVWASIQRTINGVDQIFIEHMEEDCPDVKGTREWNGLQTDCAHVLVPDASGMLTGLDDLEGKRVDVIGDGIEYVPAVVTNGSILMDPLPLTMPQKVEVGLHYDSTGITNEPIIPPQVGGPMHCRRWKNLGMRVRRAGPGLTINIDESDDIGLPIRTPAMAMDVQVPLQDGKLCAEQLDYSVWARVRFKQTRPFPVEVLNIVGELEISDEWCCDTEPSPTSAPIAPPPLPPAPAPTCPDLFPAAQDLGVVCCYNVDAGFGNVGGNHAGMMAHVDDDGTFWFTISTNSGFGVGVYPPDSNTQWHLLKGFPDCSFSEVTPLPFPNYTLNFIIGQSPQSGSNGKSDEKCYMLTGHSISPILAAIAPNAAATVFFGNSFGASAFFLSLGDDSVATGAWSKEGDKFFSVYHSGAGDTWMLRFPMGAPDGTFEDLKVLCSTCLPGFDNVNMQMQNVLMMHATANFVWVLARSGTSSWLNSPSSGTRLYKLDRNLNYVTHWSLDADPNFPTPWGIHVLRDADLIFMIDGGSSSIPWTIGYFNPTTGSTSVIGQATQTCTNAGAAVGNPGQSGFEYAKNYFYLSYAGFGLGLTNTVKLGPLTCPSDTNLLWQN